MSMNFQRYFSKVQAFPLDKWRIFKIFPSEFICFPYSLGKLFDCAVMLTFREQSCCNRNKHEVTDVTQSFFNFKNDNSKCYYRSMISYVNIPFLFSPTNCYFRKLISVFSWRLAEFYFLISWVVGKFSFFSLKRCDSHKGEKRENSARLWDLELKKWNWERTEENWRSSFK